jgi:hypothetical protein
MCLYIPRHENLNLTEIFLFCTSNHRYTLSKFLSAGTSDLSFQCSEIVRYFSVYMRGPCIGGTSCNIHQFL